MKTIVLANLKQVFQTIMTLCNILQLRVLSHNKNVVVYSDLFNDEKIILLNKEYSEVIYHDYTNNVHVCYEINNSEQLFIEYYNRYENSTDIISKLNEVIEKLEKDNNDLNNEIEHANKELAISENNRHFIDSEYQELMRKYEILFDENETNKELLNEFSEVILYNDEKIESLQNEISILENNNERMSSKLAYYETEYKNTIAEKLQQYEDRNYHITECAMKIIKGQKDEINQLNNIINDKDLVIETMTKRINHLYKVIRQMKKA